MLWYVLLSYLEGRRAEALREGLHSIPSLKAAFITNRQKLCIDSANTQFLQPFEHGMGDTMWGPVYDS